MAAAFFNVAIAKSVHELLEHQHEENFCENNTSNHFHEHEFAHADFICSFNFSTSLVAKKPTIAKRIVRLYERKLQVKYLWLVHTIFLDGISLRGPPVY